MARFSLTCPPWQVISVLHVHNPTVSKRLRYSLNQMHMRIPWRCRGLQPLLCDSIFIYLVTFKLLQ
ncbi:hypothetical protein DW975_07700 [Agathobacter rectalis]|uniref:Uncharacterized protein n=1 Tax=Agathobacter rectalis TaxID=39491 RepID=A0A413PGN9_9FIRM|nr:hypothetical protein DW975_07700 [Agathobacter rectalis]